MRFDVFFDEFLGGKKLFQIDCNSSMLLNDMIKHDTASMSRVCALSAELWTALIKNAREVMYRNEAAARNVLKNKIFVLTFHSLQGSTLESLILSLGAIESTSRKIADLSLTSLLVGTSRVHDFANISSRSSVSIEWECKCK